MFWSWNTLGNVTAAFTAGFIWMKSIQHSKFESKKENERRHKQISNVLKGYEKSCENSKLISDIIINNSIYHTIDQMFEKVNKDIDILKNTNNENEDEYKLRKEKWEELKHNGVIRTLLLIYMSVISSFISGLLVGISHRDTINWQENLERCKELNDKNCKSCQNLQKLQGRKFQGDYQLIDKTFRHMIEYGLKQLNEKLKLKLNNENFLLTKRFDKEEFYDNIFGGFRFDWNEYKQMIFKMKENTEISSNSNIEKNSLDIIKLNGNYIFSTKSDNDNNIISKNIYLEEIDDLMNHPDAFFVFSSMIDSAEHYLLDFIFEAQQCEPENEQIKIPFIIAVAKLIQFFNDKERQGIMLDVTSFHLNSSFYSFFRNYSKTIIF